MTFIEAFCISALTTISIIIMSTLVFCIYRLWIEYNKKMQEQHHAAILQTATRRKLSIRTNLIEEPIKRPIHLNKPLKSANFKHFKDD